VAQRKGKAKSRGAERARSIRRELERADAKLVREREKLFRLEPGGTPERPVEVASAVLVEPRASSRDCPRCRVKLKATEHSAEVRNNERLRRVEATCPRCGQVRPVWFRIVGDTLN